jgi:hypothetical protein
LETNRNVGKWKKTDRNVGKQKKTNCNVGRKTLVFSHNLSFSHTTSLVEEAEEAVVTADTATRTEADVVMDEARTTLELAKPQRMGFALLLETTCLTMDTRQLQTRCELRGRSSYSTSEQATDKTLAMSYRTRLL